MAKFYGPVGYVITEETEPGNGVWVEKTTERQYYGDQFKNTRRLQTTEALNDNVTVNNIISIVSDEFAVQNFHSIRYVGFMGANWKVTDVEVQHPRLILTLGGLYIK
jgi:hypothetical protein